MSSPKYFVTIAETLADTPEGLVNRITGISLQDMTDAEIHWMMMPAILIMLLRSGSILTTSQIKKTRIAGEFMKTALQVLILKTLLLILAQIILIMIMMTAIT